MEIVQTLLVPCQDSIINRSKKTKETQSLPKNQRNLRIYKKQVRVTQIYKGLENKRAEIKK